MLFLLGGVKQILDENEPITEQNALEILSDIWDFLISEGLLIIPWQTCLFKTL